MSKRRVNKSKEDIVSDLQLVSKSNRRRALIRDVVYPHLVEMDESIAYCKAYLPTVRFLIDGAFQDEKEKTTIGHLKERIFDKLKKTFDTKDPDQKKEYERYKSFIEKLSDVSVADFTIVGELPTYMDGYLLKDRNKDKISTVDINDILG